VITKAFTFILISTLLALLIVTIHASDALSLDTSFNRSGKVTTSFSAGDDIGSGIAVQSDDKIVVVGTSDDGSGTSEFIVARHLLNFPLTGGSGESGDSGSGGGGCFIATAAYGSPISPRYISCVSSVTDFCMKTALVAVMDIYYRDSPAMAEFISRHESVKVMVRLSLLPVVGMSWVALKLGSVVTMTLPLHF
jgi:hypothetical protein